MRTHFTQTKVKTRKNCSRVRTTTSKRKICHKGKMKAKGSITLSASNSRAATKTGCPKMAKPCTAPQRTGQLCLPKLFSSFSLLCPTTYGAKEEANESKEDDRRALERKLSALPARANCFGISGIAMKPPSAGSCKSFVCLASRPGMLSCSQINSSVRTCGSSSS